MMTLKEIMRGRVLLVDLLAILFGISSWISINGLWVELPVLVNQLPEGWALPSYLSTIVQIANIGPIGYSLLRVVLRREPPAHYIIFPLLLLGAGASLGLALAWDVTTHVLNAERSTLLFVFVFLLSLVDCTSSVLFLPYMGLFRDVYLNSYLVGEGMSGFVPSIVALAQGVGGNPTCQNVTYPNGSVILQPVTEEPRFSAQDFFLFLMGMMIISLLAFILLHILPVAREERNVETLVVRGGRGSSDSSLREGSPTSLTRYRPSSGGSTASTTSEPRFNSSEKDSTIDINLEPRQSTSQDESMWPLLLLLAMVCSLANGALPSIQSYSCLPYGNTVYHLSATLNAMANPLMAFLAMFLPCHSRRVVGLLSLVGGLATCYILATALNSPDELWGTGGGVLTVFGWVFVGALFSYVKVSIAGMCREAGALFYCGAATQLGSAVGAMTAFILVTQTTLFTGYYVTCSSP